MAIAMPNNACSHVPPAANTASSGRYAAIAKSSSTRIDSTAGVSLLPSRRRSDSSRAITPEDEMYVTPARARIPTPLSPSSAPAIAPGPALSNTSTHADGRCRRRLLANSPMENSSPRVRSSSTTPIDAPVLPHCAAAGIGAMPPSPRARPATRYSGIGDSANRRAAVPNTVSTVRMTPSSSSSVADTCIAQLSAGGAARLPCATISSTPEMPSSVPMTTSTSLTRNISPGPGDARTASSRTIATIEGPVDERASGSDGHLSRVEPGDLAGQVCEAFGDPRCAKDLGKGLGLVVGEAEHLLGLVGIIAGVDDDFEFTGAPGDNTDTVTVPILKLESQTHTGQQNLFDVHGFHTSRSSIGLRANFRRFGHSETFGRHPSRRPEEVSEPVAPARRVAHVAGDRHVLPRLQLPDVEGVHLLGEAVVRSRGLRLEAAEEPVPEDEDAAVVAVQVLLVHAVVHPVM